VELEEKTPLTLNQNERNTLTGLPITVTSNVKQNFWYPRFPTKRKIKKLFIYEI